MPRNDAERPRRDCKADQLQCHRLEHRRSCYQHLRVPSQGQIVERPDQRASGQPCTRIQNEHEHVVFRCVESVHCLFIHCKADQHPITTPTSSNGALQKMPEPNLWSSHRPMNRPISMGVTMIQPSTPIWPTKRAIDGSPS